MTTVSARPELLTTCVSTLEPDRIEHLRAACGPIVAFAGEPAYETGRAPWNAAVTQYPALVATPRNAADVARVIRAAAAVGLRVAPQGTGHNAGPLQDLTETILLRTSALTGAHVDPISGLARVGAGTLWADAVAAASRADRAVLHGSSPDVGVVGYSLGGGTGWYARQLGLQANSITAAHVVLADGSTVRADADHERDLFWALRGGGGNFGVVTELEFRTYELGAPYAGMMAWDWHDSGPVLRRWAAWAGEAPDEVTTSFRILQLPPLPELPAHVRGRALAVIDGALLADDDRARALLAPLRELRPQIDTFAPSSPAALLRLHMDPEGPTPVVSATAMLGDLPSAAIDALVNVSGPGSGSTLLLAELRQLGGALARPAPDAGALPLLDGQFLLFGAAVAFDAGSAAAGQLDADRLVTAVEPWNTGTKYLNFAENSTDSSTAYAPDTWARLRAVRSAVDPGNLFHANHPIRPARAVV